jgi:CPA1 family monovalent cation:H+ antiporter
LTLPLLIRLLNVTGDGKADCEESVARRTANQAALAYLEDIAKSETEYREQLDLLQAQYHERLAQLESSESATGSSSGEEDRPASPFHEFALQALRVEHDALIDLRNKHRINDETLRVVQRDVDLAETRLIEMAQ